MTTIKEQNKILWSVLFVMTLILVIGVLISIKYSFYNKVNNEDKICLKVSEFKRFNSPISKNELPLKIHIDDSRDRRVLNDPLYPALNIV